MLNRRHFLSTAAAVGAGLMPGTATSASRSAAELKPSGTLLPYAICAETFWKDKPFLDRLHLIADAGFTYFDFWRFMDKDVEAIAKVCRERKLIPLQFVAGWSMNSAERRAKFLEELRAAIPFAARLGIKLMTTIAGFEIPGMTRELQVAEVTTTLAQAAPIAQAAGVTLVLEATNVLVDHAGQLIFRSADAAAIVRAVNSPHVRMLFDVYHQQVSEGNLSGNIAKYQDIIAYYQIADHPGRHEAGTGEINWPFILRTIYSTGYRGPVGLELFPKGDVQDAIKAVLAADHAARQGIV